MVSIKKMKLFIKFRCNDKIKTIEKKNKIIQIV